MAMADKPGTAVFGLLASMRREERLKFGLDRLPEQLARTVTNEIRDRVRRNPPSRRLQAIA